MSDYWNIIDDIRTVLENTQSIYAEHRETLRGIARNYDAAVGEVNGRLRQCAQYLRKGNLGEAVRLAETEPNVLDMFAVLDFPERESWNEILSAMELPPAAPLNREISREIGDAIARTAPLEPLLRKHRFLALALAPLSLRLQTLREIATADPGNSVWGDDIKAYEKDRVVELRNETDVAIRAQDLPKLAQLETELASPDWLGGRPEDLLLNTQRELQSLKLSATIVSMRKLAEQFSEAYRLQDVEKGLSLRESWNSLAAQLRSPIPGSLQRQVGPALDWLKFNDERQRKGQFFQDKQRRLKSALQDKAKPDELLRIRNEVAEAADAVGQTIPDDLENEVEARLETATSEATSRRKFFLIGGAIAAVFVIAVLFILVGQALRLQRIDAAVAEIQAVIENHSPATKPKSIETLNKFRSPNNPLGNESAVREQLEKLEELVDGEK